MNAITWYLFFPYQDALEKMHQHAGFVEYLMVVATATLNSYTNIAVALETPLRLCSLSRTFQGNPRGDHRLPFPTC